MSQTLHPLTVVLRGGSRGLGFAAFGFFFGGPAGEALDLPGGVGASVVLGALGLLIGVGYEFARVSRFEYDLTDDTLDIRSGVLARREREIPFRRVQNVDVTRDLLGRILGLAVVEIETAGGGGTEAAFRYLGLADARALQEGIRERKRLAGADDDRATVPDETVDAGIEEAGLEPGDAHRVDSVEQEVLFELDDRELLLASALSFDLRALSLLLFVGPLVWPIASSLPGDLGALAGALLALVATVAIVGSVLAIWVAGAARTFVRFYGFRLTQRGDELRYERGLVQRYEGSIPIDKIQSLSIDENVLMRRFGYASLAVETAGYAPGSAPSGGSEAAVPIASRERVFDLADRLADVEEPSFERPPAVARRRYAFRYALGALALSGAALAIDTFVTTVPWYLLLSLVALAPFAGRATWRHRGRALEEDHVFTRNGFWQRRIQAVPYYRVQTIIERRTIFQRRWGLSTVVIDTAGTRSLVGGDAAAVDLATETAVEFRGAVADRFRDALVERDGSGAAAGPGDGSMDGTGNRGGDD